MKDAADLPSPGGDALSGGFADPPRMAAQAFRAALEAMARPGRIVTMAGAAPPAPASPAAGALLLVLADGTTPLWLAPSHDTPALRAWIAFHTRAPLVAAERAILALGRWEALQPVSRLAAGTPEYPDRSATLIVELPALEPRGPRLSGPGIAAGTTAALPLPDPAAFAANAARFPLGWDAFLTCGDRVAGLPRSTRVELA